MSKMKIVVLCTSIICLGALLFIFGSGLNLKSNFITDNLGPFPKQGAIKVNILPKSILKPAGWKIQNNPSSNSFFNSGNKIVVNVGTEAVIVFSAVEGYNKPQPITIKVNQPKLYEVTAKYTPKK